VFCGESFKFGKGAAARAKDLAALLPSGVTAHVEPTVDVLGLPVSTTRIRGLLEAGDMQNAAKLLGRPYLLDFEVSHGNRIGRTLSWPTINQVFPERFVLPRFGVYASVTYVAGRPHRSVTNVGVKPTVGSGAALAETYIEGFSGDLYGEKIPVELHGFIRPELKFAGLKELKAQILADLKEALK
jgi:riboflavin kinase/FMN adenylyltransferase